ncbi:hypothetical protein F0562_017374 [Nyssa sinensis]|uniref:Rx N-terminal domain-containing protein n=1 Tax=Nyssa sinensis TaxID=561372 RepID=A0A5J4ZIP5_9ASTE|nr:hypothetical protein F0562_017374 [Nyssa sinensis]
MAESFAFSIAEKVLGKLGDFVLQEICMACGIKQDLEKIKDNITTIKAVLLDAEKKRSSSEHLSLWLEKTEGILYGADDLLDEFEYETLRQKVVNRGTIMEKVRHFFSCSNPIVFRFRMAHEIKAIKERLNEAKSEMSLFALTCQETEGRAVSSVRETCSLLDSRNVIGRENDKEKIINLLMGSNDRESLSVIPIVGIGGMGKTTLATMVYNEKKDRLSGCCQLKELPRNIGDLISLRCMMLTAEETHFSKERMGSLTSLRILRIIGCSELVNAEGMQSLAALRTFVVFACPNLVYLPLRYLRALENLEILDCEKLDLMMMDEQRKEKDVQLGGGLSRLRYLHILRIPHLETLPQWLQGASKTLEVLRIRQCDNFTTLPEWMANFKSLQKLEIVCCEKLTSLPEGMRHLTSLKEIHFEGMGRSQWDIREDWHKISHVPNIYFDGQDLKSIFNQVQ